MAEKGDATFKDQDSAQASYCKMTNREDGRIDFNEAAEKIYNRFRAYTPWPGIFTMYEGKRLKLLDITLGEKNLKPGLVHYESGTLIIGTSKSSLQIKLLQLEGKKSASVEAFISGYPKFCESSLPS